MLPAGQGEKYSTAAKPDSADGQNTSPVFAQGEMHRRRAHLAEAELRLQRYKQDHNVSSLKDQRRLLLEQHTALSTNLKTILNQAAGFREKLSWLQTRKATLEETIPLSTLTDQQRMLDEAKEEQLRLQLKEQELLMKFQEGNRQVHTTRREIDLVGAFIADQEKRLQKHVTTGKNPVYLELELELLRTEADLRASEAQAEVIKQQLEDSQQAILLLDSRERTLVELQRDVAISESLYYDYVTRAGLYPGQDYRVQVGDHLEVKFFYNPELNQMVSVRRDGRIALQLVGEVDAAGATVEELTRELMIRYRDEVKHPKITVMVDTSRPHLQRDFYRPGVAESAK